MIRYTCGRCGSSAPERYCPDCPVFVADEKLVEQLKTMTAMWEGLKYRVKELFDELEKVKQERDLLAFNQILLQKIQKERDTLQGAENTERSNLPSEHPNHIHGVMCDGQDGTNSYCARLRTALGYK